MTSNIFFSVIIPTYNRGDLILETINSVLDQKYTHYEIIVVDNCSTDNTMELLLPLVNSRRVKYIRHDKNYERSKSRNTGIAEAEGDFLTFLDSDDFMYVDCLIDAAEFIEKNPDIKFFQNLYELVDNDRNKIYSFKFPSLSNQYRALANGNFISCIGGFIHKEIYKTIRFIEDEKMIGSEDYEVWFKIVARYKMGRINKVNSGIREHSNRSVNSGVYENLEYQKKVLIERINKDPVTCAKFKPYMSRIVASFNLQKAVISNQHKNQKLSLTYLGQAIKVDPNILFTSRFFKILFNTFRL